ncbi:leucine-rich repeat-containing protein 46 [Lingula anatina]|uniref:Leucine-rich repeat-containing protein 46 n=1 Tax=Lingula anatina TaxID=7574 RepID=A0A1S3H678_LINAN|nr:leucine-rich repeat-containing protein 46 [Lingula anatina]|eukprot:XP_013380629.1 leucine-rich repeat-containing protein 46 [Lingula anatina]
MNVEDDFEEYMGKQEPEPEVRPQRLSLHMIVRRHLPPEAADWPQDLIVESLNKITHLRLDRENIGDIDGLELLGKSVTNVYLQQNKIKRIENLDCLHSLRFLTLAGNKIRTIENLMCLPKLAFLDLSENLIETLDVEELPQSLIILSLKENQCTSEDGYRPRLIKELPKLRQLDGVEVRTSEKRAVGYVISSDEEEEEEEEEEENNVDDAADVEHTIEQIKGVFKTLTSDMLLRSQQRLEDTLKEHKLHNVELEAIRCQSAIPELASSRASNMSDSRIPSALSTGSRSSTGVSGSRSPLAHPVSPTSRSGSRLGSQGSPLPPIPTQSER